MQCVNVKVSRDDARWEVRVKADIPANVLMRYREETLKELQKDAKLDGFRPGKAPIERVVQAFGEGAVLRQTAQHAIERELPEILAQEKLLVVEAPRVSSEPPAEDKPLSFEAVAALAPEVKLPDWRAIAAKHAAKKESVEVSEQEHADAMLHLRRERARIQKMELGQGPQAALEAARTIQEKDLPPLDDEFAKELGYESGEKFIEALRGNMKSEKESQAQQKLRTAILDDIVKEALLRYPAVMREYELDDIEERMKADLVRLGRSMDEYLAQQKKTREQLREEWRDAADKRAKVRLVLNEIAREAHVSADESLVARELTHAKEHYANVPEEQLRAGIAHALRNEAVMQLLENK